MNAVTTPSRISPVEQFVEQVLPADRKQSLFAGLPSHIKPAVFERNLANAIMANPGLMKYDPRLVFREVSKAAGLGLLLDPQLQEAYILEAYNYKSRSTEPQLRVGYRGMTKLARQSGDIENIYAHEVRANDHIEAELGAEKKLIHKPTLFSDRGPIIGYYAVAKFKSGEFDFEPMSVEEVHKIRDRSDAWKAFSEGKIRSTPWSTDEEEMAKKTVIRRIVKRLPQSPQMAEASRIEDQAEAIDGRYTVVQTRTLAQPPQAVQQVTHQQDQGGFSGGHDSGDQHVDDQQDQGSGKPADDFKDNGRDHPKPQEAKPAEAKAEPPKAKRKPNGWPALFQNARLVIEDGIFTKDAEDSSNVGLEAEEGDYEDADLVLTDGAITKNTVVMPGAEPAFDAEAAVERIRIAFENADSMDSLEAAKQARKDDYEKLKAKNLHEPTVTMFRAAEARIMEADRETEKQNDPGNKVDGGEDGDPSDFPGDANYKAPAAPQNNDDLPEKNGINPKAQTPAIRALLHMTCDEYEAYCIGYFAEATDAQVLHRRFVDEDAVRTYIGMPGDQRKKLRGLRDERKSELTGE